MAIVLPKFPNHRPPTAHGSAKQPAVNVSLCREDGAYAAGSALKVGWRISRVSVDELQSVEVSVLWHTQGKGDEDLGVHHFHRYDESDLKRLGLSDRQQIQCRLPASPLSYRGHLLQIHWGVRVRMFLKDGREIMAEHPFYVVVAPAIADTESTETVTRTDEAAAPRTLRHRVPQAIRMWRRRARKQFSS